MTGRYIDDDDLFDGWDDESGQEQQRRQSEGGRLREVLEQVLATNKKLTERLDSYEQAEAQKGLAGKVASRQLDPRVVELIPQGLDSKAQDEWLEARSEWLPKVSQQQTPSADDETEPPQNEDPITSTLTPSEEAALRGMTQEAQSGPSTPAPNMTPAQKLANFDTANGDEDEFWAFIGSQTP